MHGALQRQAANHADGFASLWPAWKERLAGATQAYANLEGPAAAGLRAGGREAPDPGLVFDGRVYTSYPLFNYPPRLLADLQASGVDVVSTANNHSLDRGPLGVDRTLAAAQDLGLATAGTRESTGQRRGWSSVVHRGDFKVAWIACSFSTNGLPDPHDQVLDCHQDREELLLEVASYASDPTLSAIIVTPHWGNEYQATPHARDIALGRALVDAGASLVIGAHPHVPQPLEYYTAPDGRRAVIAYSLGNFVSGQFHRVATQSALGLEAEWVGRPGERAVLTRVRVHAGQMASTPQGLQALDTAPHAGVRAAQQKSFGPGLGEWWAVQPRPQAPGEVNH